MNDKCDCRTALATPGPLNIDFELLALLIIGASRNNFGRETYLPHLRGRLGVLF